MSQHVWWISGNKTRIYIYIYIHLECCSNPTFGSTVHRIAMSSTAVIQWRSLTSKFGLSETRLMCWVTTLLKPCCRAFSHTWAHSLLALRSSAFCTALFTAYCPAFLGMACQASKSSMALMQCQPQSPSAGTSMRRKCSCSWACVPAGIWAELFATTASQTFVMSFCRGLVARSLSQMQLKICSFGALAKLGATCSTPPSLHSKAATLRFWSPAGSKHRKVGVLQWGKIDSRIDCICSHQELWGPAAPAPQTKRHSLVQNSWILSDTISSARELELKTLHRESKDISIIE